MSIHHKKMRKSVWERQSGSEREGGECWMRRIERIVSLPQLGLFLLWTRLGNYRHVITRANLHRYPTLQQLLLASSSGEDLVCRRGRVVLLPRRRHLRSSPMAPPRSPGPHCPRYPRHRLHLLPLLHRQGLGLPSDRILHHHRHPLTLPLSLSRSRPLQTGRRCRFLLRRLLFRRGRGRRGLGGGGGA